MQQTLEISYWNFCLRKQNQPLRIHLLQSINSSIESREYLHAFWMEAAWTSQTHKLVFCWIKFAYEIRVQGKVPELKRGIAMASRRGQILLTVFYQTWAFCPCGLPLFQLRDLCFCVFYLRFHKWRHQFEDPVNANLYNKSQVFQSFYTSRQSPLQRMTRLLLKSHTITYACGTAVIFAMKKRGNPLEEGRLNEENE